MVVHHDYLKLCTDRDIPIWLLKKTNELTGTLGEDGSDQIIEQATDALRDRDEYGEGYNLGLETCLLR